MKTITKSEADKSLGRMEKILLYVYISLIVSMAAYFAFSQTAKDVIISQLSKMDQFSVEWFFKLLVAGIPLVCIGFPLTILELSVASVIKNFYFSFLLCFTAKCLGTFLCFFLGRLLLREKLAVLLGENKYYKTLKFAVNVNPFKFALLFKFMLIPHLVKNYSLAISPLPFPYFFAVTIIVTTFYTAVWVYLGTNLRGIYDAYGVDHKSSQLFIATKIGLILLSLTVTVYLLYYASRLYQEFEVMRKDNLLVKEEISEEEKEDNEGNYGTCQ